MLNKARSEINKAEMSDIIRVAQADAVTFPRLIFGDKTYQRIFFSYTLSMIPNWVTALERAVDALPPGGSLLVADFGDQRDVPPFFRYVLHRWLSLFSVTPRNELENVMREMAARRGLLCDFQRLYHGYAFLAALRRPGS
jgi:S-adenosylmethionine-diacylgycerolhomoserine-N-methlytransferase